MSIECFDCLKRERDIFIKAMSSGGKMAFVWTPALRSTAQDLNHAKTFPHFSTKADTSNFKTSEPLNILFFDVILKKYWKISIKGALDIRVG